MELLTVLNARSIWGIDQKRLNPRGKNIDYDLVKWLKETYHFRQYPSQADFESPSPEGLVFTGGSFEAAAGNTVDNYLVDLTIFNDAVVANTRHSTGLTDKFLHGLLARVTAEFGLTLRLDAVQRKLYVSELEIKLIRSLRFFSPEIEEFAAKITSYYPGPLNFQFASVGFWPDPSIQQWRPSPFVIERRINEPENIHYSRAPLKTEDHEKLLQDFEELLMHNAMTDTPDQSKS